MIATRDPLLALAQPQAQPQSLQKQKSTQLLNLGTGESITFDGELKPEDVEITVTSNGKNLISVNTPKGKLEIPHYGKFGTSSYYLDPTKDKGLALNVQNTGIRMFLPSESVKGSSVKNYSIGSISKDGDSLFFQVPKDSGAMILRIYGTNGKLLAPSNDSFKEGSTGSVPPAVNPFAKPTDPAGSVPPAVDPFAKPTSTPENVQVVPTPKETIPAEQPKEKAASQVDYVKVGKEFGKTGAKLGVSVTAGLGGAALGGAIGTFFFPGVGTIIGAAIGSAIGSAAASVANQKVIDQKENIDWAEVTTDAAIGGVTAGAGGIVKVANATSRTGCILLRAAQVIDATPQASILKNSTNGIVRAGGRVTQRAVSNTIVGTGGRVTYNVLDNQHEDTSLTNPGAIAQDIVFGELMHQGIKGLPSQQVSNSNNNTPPPNTNTPPPNTNTNTPHPNEQNRRNEFTSQFNKNNGSDFSFMFKNSNHKFSDAHVRVNSDGSYTVKVEGEAAKTYQANEKINIDGVEIDLPELIKTRSTNKVKSDFNDYFVRINDNSPLEFSFKDSNNQTVKVEMRLTEDGRIWTEISEKNGQIRSASTHAPGATVNIGGIEITIPALSTEQIAWINTQKVKNAEAAKKAKEAEEAQANQTPHPYEDGIRNSFEEGFSKFYKSAVANNKFEMSFYNRDSKLQYAIINFSPDGSGSLHTKDSKGVESKKQYFQADGKINIDGVEINLSPLMRQVDEKIVRAHFATQFNKLDSTNTEFLIPEMDRSGGYIADHRVRANPDGSFTVTSSDGSSRNYKSSEKINLSGIEIDLPTLIKTKRENTLKSDFAQLFSQIDSDNIQKSSFTVLDGEIIEVSMKLTKQGNIVCEVIQNGTKSSNVYKPGDKVNIAGIEVTIPDLTYKQKEWVKNQKPILTTDLPDSPMSSEKEYRSWKKSILLLLHPEGVNKQYNVQPLYSLVTSLDTVYSSTLHDPQMFQLNGHTFLRLARIVKDSIRTAASKGTLIEPELLKSIEESIQPRMPKTLRFVPIDSTSQDQGFANSRNERLLSNLETMLKAWQGS